MKNFIIKRTWRIHNKGQKCAFVNYLTEPYFTNSYGRESWHPDINKAFIFDDQPLRKYLGEDCELIATSFYPEGDFVDKEHITPDWAYKQECVEIETETEKIIIPESITEVIKIKRVINN